MTNEKYYAKTKIIKITKDEQKENVLSLGNFLDYFGINLIPYDLESFNMDDLSYEFIQTYDNKTILEFFENYDYLDLDNYDLKNLDNHKLNEILQENYNEFLYYYGIQYFQYFIVDGMGAALFKKYCNYDIVYNCTNDVYVVCIDHIGTSWYMINTNYSLDHLNVSYLFDNQKDIYQLFESID